MTASPAPTDVGGLVERLRSKLPVCPYDPRSPEYLTAPDDKPCKVCGTKNEFGAPDLCRGADTSCMAEAAALLETQASALAEKDAALKEAGEALEGILPVAETMHSIIGASDARKIVMGKITKARSVLSTISGAGI